MYAYAQARVRARAHTHTHTHSLQVHDELVYEVRADRLADVAGMVKAEMERAMPLRVPTPAKLSVGLSWGTLEPVTLEQLKSGFLPT